MEAKKKIEDIYDNLFPTNLIHSKEDWEKFQKKLIFHKIIQT